MSSSDYNCRSSLVLLCSLKLVKKKKKKISEMHKVKNLMNKTNGELNCAPTGPFRTDSFQTLNGTYGSLQGHRFLV